MPWKCPACQTAISQHGIDAPAGPESIAVISSALNSSWIPIPASSVLAPLPEST